MYCLLKTAPLYCLLKTAQMYCLLKTAQMYCLLKTAQMYCLLKTAQMWCLLKRMSDLLLAARFSFSSPTVQRAVQDVTATYGIEAASVWDSVLGFFETCSTQGNSLWQIRDTDIWISKQQPGLWCWLSDFQGQADSMIDDQNVLITCQQWHVETTNQTRYTVPVVTINHSSKFIKFRIFVAVPVKECMMAFHRMIDLNNQENHDSHLSDVQHCSKHKHI